MFRPRIPCRPLPLRPERRAVNFCTLTPSSLGVSEPTVRRHWAIARAWLYAEMKASEGPALSKRERCEK